MQQQSSSQVLLRSPRIAQRVFGLDSPGQIVRSVPRAKFMFKAEFVPSEAALPMLQGANLNSSTDIRSIAFKVKAIDKPRVNLTTVELNQYNKKKLAYSKVDYNDASIRIYDTVDNSMLALWINYFTYYFGDSRPKDEFGAWQQSSVGAKYVDSTGWGFRPINENVYFFNSIDVSAFYGQTMTTFRYINPRIVSIDWQNKDYSLSDLEEITINFKYEGIVYERFGQPISDYDTGWQSNDTIDYPYGYATTPTHFQPRIFSMQTATYNTAQQPNSTTTNPGNIMGGIPMSTSAIAPGATIPNSLLNNQLLQPNNLVSGLAMAMNYIPNGIQGVNNIPFATIASLAGVKGIGGLSTMFGDAIRTQLSGVGSNISNLFNTSQIQNIFTSGVPQSASYMCGVTSSQLPDITSNADSGGFGSVDPGAIGGQATSPAIDLGTTDLGIGAGSQGAEISGGLDPNTTDLGVGADGQGAEISGGFDPNTTDLGVGASQSDGSYYEAAYEPPDNTSINDASANTDAGLADDYSNYSSSFGIGE